MKAMVLEAISRIDENPSPLRMVELPEPVPGVDELLIRVDVCAVCHTELDEIEGRTPPPRLPVVLGHQVVGTVAGVGREVKRFERGQRVGVAWIYSACGHCKFCLSDRENLCLNFQATGRDVHGGYAEYMKVPEAFTHSIPDAYSSAQAAPLLCAGAIGYRSLRLAGLVDGQTLGLTGFGASGHLVLSLVRHIYPLSKVYVFARNPKEREFALDLGANWSGDTSDESPEKCDAIIDTTPVWKPIVEALKNLESGGRLVINAIRKEAIDKEYLLEIDYPVHLWLEKEIKSVANVTRRDVGEFLEIAADIGIKPEIETYVLAEANRALTDLKNRSIRGAKVLQIGG